MTLTLVIALLSGLTVWYDRPHLVAAVKVDSEALLAAERNPLTPELGPLPKNASVVDASVTDNPSMVRPTGNLTVSLASVDRSNTDQALVVIDGRSGAFLAFRQITAGDAALAFTDLPTGEHWLVVCESDSTARYAYQQRIQIEIEAGLLREQSLSTQTHSLTLAIVDTNPGMAPTGKVVVVLGRQSDASWRQSRTVPARPHPRGILLDIDGLGPGDYLVSIPGFTIEGPDRMPVQIRKQTDLELRGSWRQPL